MVWLNNDGLKLKFGPEATETNPVGEYRSDGSRRWIEIHAEYNNTLPLDADGSVVLTHNTALPIGAVVEEVEIFTHVDFDSAGDALILDVGLVDMDGTSNPDVDALVDAATQTELNTGGSNVAGWVGVAVGAVPLTAPKLITWEVTVADATAGDGLIRIYYSIP